MRAVAAATAAVPTPPELLIKMHGGRTLPTRQGDVTINKLQDVGSQLCGYITLTYFY